jgi:hypothetical protein
MAVVWLVALPIASHGRRKSSLCRILNFKRAPKPPGSLIAIKLSWIYFFPALLLPPPSRTFIPVLI